MASLEERPAPGTIDTWLVELDCPEATVQALAAVLSADERERAARFVFARDRRRFIAARAALRVLLADGGPPAALRFAYSEHGKPSLVAEPGRPTLHFNLSHTGDVAVVAVTADGPLGVDVETVRALPEAPAIAARFFTAGETESIMTAPLAERDLAFFLCWTRKEAFAKALGDGLSLSLDRYRVSCRPGAPARIEEVDGSAAAGAEWSVYDLRPAPGVVGAVVMRGAPRPLRLRRLDLAADVLPLLA
jgi:4'-phosphopantetheinyl transferase